MKNKKMQKAIIYSVKNDLSTTGIFMICAYIVGMVLWTVGTGVTKDFEEGIITVGSIMALAVGLFSLVFVGGCTTRSRFNMAVGMSFSRKNFIICDLISTVIVTCLVLATGALMYLCESRFYMALYSSQSINADLESFMRNIMSVPMILLIIAMVLMVREVAGLVLLAMGDKGIFVLLAIYWTMTIVISKIETMSIAGRIGKSVLGVYSKLASVSPSLPHLIGVDVLLLITYLVSIGIRRQAVV